jgi:hypothetical protein
MPGQSLPHAIERRFSWRQCSEQHFRRNPSLFGKFNQDPKSATPISVPKNVPEVFLH